MKWYHHIETNRVSRRRSITQRHIPYYLYIYLFIVFIGDTRNIRFHEFRSTTPTQRPSRVACAYRYAEISTTLISLAYQLSIYPDCSIYIRTCPFRISTPLRRRGELLINLFIFLFFTAPIQRNKKNPLYTIGTFFFFIYTCLVLGKSKAQQGLTAAAVELPPLCSLHLKEFQMIFSNFHRF